MFFIVYFEHISHPFFSISIVNFEQVHVSWKTVFEASVLPAYLRAVLLTQL